MSNTTVLNAMWFQTTCPACGHVYQWHREGRNRCTKCRADYGYLITTAELHAGLDKIIQKFNQGLR